MKNIKGYISSNLINNNLVSQKVQNLVIRKFCEDKNFTYNLSNTEYIHDQSFIGLNEIIENIDNYVGIVAYSMHQLPRNKKIRARLINKIVRKNKFISFAMEDIIINDSKSIEYLELLINLNNFILKN